MSRISILGGTGPEGVGLALRFALAGSEVVIGSRSESRARSTAAALTEKLRAAGKDPKFLAMQNSAAARNAEIVVFAFPYAGVAELAAALRRDLEKKIVIDVVNPLVFENGAFRSATIEAGSAGEEIQRLLPKSQVVSAFKSQSASKLQRIEMPMQGDVLVCSDHADARRRALELAAGIRALRPVDAGLLVNARALESVTALLLNLNHGYEAVTSIQILGLPR